nr:hypothetical protein [Natrinema limicola]
MVAPIGEFAGFVVFADAPTVAHDNRANIPLETLNDNRFRERLQAVDPAVSALLVELSRFPRRTRVELARFLAK